MNDNPRLRLIIAASIITVMVAMWLIGCIKESNIFAWFIFAIVGNSSAILTAVHLNRLLHFGLTILCDFLFYVIIELDAPLSINPVLFYCTLYSLFLAGVIWHYCRHRRDVGKLSMLLLSDTLLNGLFFSLDMGWLMI